MSIVEAVASKHLVALSIVVVPQNASKISLKKQGINNLYQSTRFHAQLSSKKYLSI